MEWACRFHPVPRPLARGRDAEGSWLVTAPIPGDSAATARWKAEPAVAVTAIGEGLRAMHDSLPTAGCPFSWSAEQRLAAARRKADVGGLGIADRWADLAIATWSAGWNYGPGWDRPLLDAYGVEPDPDRTRYYRLLWELG